MPIYTFYCDKCQRSFEHVSSISSYREEDVRCDLCNGKKISRSYVDDARTIVSGSVKKSDSELKTLGDLAKRNTDRMSNDQKEELKFKHNKYKEEKSVKTLPKGMSRMNKPKHKTKWT